MSMLVHCQLVVAGVFTVYFDVEFWVVLGEVYSSVIVHRPTGDVLLEGKWACRRSLSCEVDVITTAGGYVSVFSDCPLVEHVGRRLVFSMKGIAKKSTCAIEHEFGLCVRVCPSAA